MKHAVAALVAMTVLMGLAACSPPPAELDKRANEALSNGRFEDAARLFQKVADAGPLDKQGRENAGYRDAVCGLAHMYATGVGVPRNAKTAVADYLACADTYNRGSDTTAQDMIDQTRAITQAADLGDAGSQVRVGQRYSPAALSNPVPPDLGTAVKYYTLAAAQHAAMAEYDLSRLYASDKYGMADKARAFGLLQAAAQDGSADAKIDLGLAYMGIGDLAQPKAYANALSLLSAAVAQDPDATAAPAAEHYLGLLYLNGWGTAKDPARGEALLAKAKAAGW